MSGEDAIASVKGYNSTPKEVILNEVEREYIPEEVVTEILVWRSLLLQSFVVKHLKTADQENTARKQKNNYT